MPRLSCMAFGRSLINTLDLDPVYVLIEGCEELKNDSRWMERYLLAYWCFYHMGTAAWISSVPDDKEFWTRMKIAASSKQYPRCPERRHFRGDAAIRSVDYLESRGISTLFLNLYRAQPAKEAMREVQEWRGFGPWIAFKVADMLERLSLAEIKFDPREVSIFESPRKGAEQLRRSLSADVSDERVTSWALETLIERFSDLKAPPLNDRPIGAQEAETVLCKYWKYVNNKYVVGEDIEEQRKCLSSFKNKNKLINSLIQVGEETLWSIKLET